MGLTHACKLCTCMPATTSISIQHAHVQFTPHKNFRNKANKKVSCKNIHKCRDGAASHLKLSTCTNTPHWQQKDGVPCLSDNPQPLQVTIHHLQETLHTLHPGQHSQASRHFEAIVTIPTSGNIFSATIYSSDTIVSDIYCCDSLPCKVYMM